MCKPIDLGANIIVESSTKWIGGHGTHMGGVVVDSGNFDWSSGKFPMFTEPSPGYHGLIYWDKFGPNSENKLNTAFITRLRTEGLRDLGPCQSPFGSWLLAYGLETLALRFERICENALKLTQYLENHPKVEWVCYPGLKSHIHHDRALKYFKNGLFGPVFGFGVKGGQNEAEKFMNNAKLCSHLANVGDTKTLIIQPASTTHAQLSKEAREAAGITDNFIRVSVGIEHIDDLINEFEQALNA